MMTTQEQWNCEDPVRTLGVEVPEWIDQDISPSTIQAIVQGGCASGAYMPAVTYHQAIETMHTCGDEVLDYIEDDLGDTPIPPVGSGWAGMACYYLSTAVELWADRATTILSDD